MHLDDTALFVEVASAISFHRAADRIGILNSTGSRRIDAQDRRLGFRLLHRNTRTLELTQTGQLYLERVRRVVRRRNWFTTVFAISAAVRAAFCARLFWSTSRRIVRRL